MQMTNHPNRKQKKDELIEAAVGLLVDEMMAAEWIYNPAQAAGRDGAARPSTKRLFAARDRILKHGDVFTPDEQAAAEAWQAPS
jgi:hypothetical protein